MHVSAEFLRNPQLVEKTGKLVWFYRNETSDWAELQSKDSETDFDVSVVVHTSQPESGEKWVEETLEPVESNWEAHCEYWKISGTAAGST